jgi:hypothetical protein
VITVEPDPHGPDPGVRRRHAGPWSTRLG